MPKLPLVAVAAAMQLLARCGGDSGTAIVPAQLNTSTYLDGALDAENLFRWTPRADGAPVELHVIVHNGPGELPSGLDAYAIGGAEIEFIVTESVNTWVAASGVEFDVQMHAYGGTPAPSTDACTLEIRFNSAGNGPLSGFAWLETRFLDPRTVDNVQIRISIPAEPMPADLETLRALVLHEFGHALGIVAPRPHTGHSPSALDVMHPEVRWTRLSNADLVAIRELYAMEPNILRGDLDPGMDPPDPPSGPHPPGADADGGLDPLRPFAAWAIARLRAPLPPPALRAEDPQPGAAGCRDCR
jgi:hypothetical protein